jgi:heme ABC exporter ATP-binding subunit CcmA
MTGAVTVEDLSKFYGDFPALQDISFEAKQGSCVALIGRNGAGKTTLLRMIVGFLSAGKGKIRVLGHDPRDLEARRRTGFIGHGISVYDELTASENLRLFARLYGLANPRGAAEKWLAQVGLERVRDGLVREFSRGMRQRLSVARAFLHEPAMLLLDEPFTALDDRAIAMLQGLLRDALAQGRTVLLSTHQLREALELATDVVFLERGKIRFMGPRSAEMLTDPGVIYARYSES